MKSYAGTLTACNKFFTREGGVSTGVYSSLNCSFSGADERENILENRARVAGAMGVAPAGLLGLKQVHGTTVITVRDGWEIGAGPEADAMVTAHKGLALGIITADCAPVLFSDRAGTVIGAAHAGWRGAVAGILEAVVDAMKNLGAGGISAAIGPCIHPASYEVAADLRDAVLAHDGADRKFFGTGRPGHWQFDLPGYCAARLEKRGVGAEILPYDTCASPKEFFSHRRRTLQKEGAIGHHISVVRL